MMPKFLKMILTTTCFAFVLTPIVASDDEGESGSSVDISSLFGGGRQEQQPSISSLLLQQIPGNSLSDTTENLIQIFETGGTFSFVWKSDNDDLKLDITYSPNSEITSSMESFIRIESSLASTLSTALQRTFFPDGDYSTQNCTARAKKVAQQTSDLKTLGNPKLLSFYQNHPELFGEGGLNAYVKANLQGAFTASQTYAEEEEKLDQALLQKVLGMHDPLVFTFAFPRTDGILRDKKSNSEKVFGNTCRTYVMDANKKGTVSIGLCATQQQVKASLGDRTITSGTGLSNIISEFESLVTQTLKSFLTAAAMKSGTSSRPSMYH
ncbi:MAG: hypothetical protein KF798_04360 [Candidatus Paracaedibacteraceae bacterium]|nr:hypothetical protein [Candidatus Paracaedibacteraceae bacterium]